MNESSGREIITLQVGRYANFVGTHFWNFQDELLLLASRGGVVDAPYEHGVLHRQAAERSRGGGGGASGERTPRLVAFDTRDALGSLNPLGLVGGGGARSTETAEAAQPSWAGGVSVFRQPSLERNALHEYLDNEDTAANAVVAGGGSAAEGGGGGGGVSSEKEEDEDEEMEEARATGDVTRLTKHPFGLDDTVTSWPDFLKSRLHPRALQELPFRDESSDFGLYASGGGGGGGSRSSALGESDREQFSDALRQQLEECEAAQGTQTLVDLEGGWSGLGSALALELQEECRNRPRVCYALLRQKDAPAGPGCHAPGAMGGGAAVGAGGAARSAVNLALGLHGLNEAFSLSFVLDEEACNAETSPHMAIDPSNAYHTSAVLGAAVDVATSPVCFSSTGLDAWASGRGGGVGGVPMAGGGGAFGDGRRAPPPGADMTLATLSAWLPLPHPDASAETLARLLSEHADSSRDAGSIDDPSLAASASKMVSLGPVARRRRGNLRRGRGKSLVPPSAAGGGHVSRVYSRQTVLRGCTAPRDHQLLALEEVLGRSAVGSGSSYSVSTPLPIPITYPLIFRESLGLRGELMPSAGASRPAEWTSGGASGKGGGGRGAITSGELRVMCDQISGVACAERDSRMGSFISQVAAGLDVRRGGVLLELEKNDMHKDDVIEVLENLTTLAESYGYSKDEDEEEDTR
ncbi:unnamed protein product [Ectocarpus sp. 12 AP-2014]